jgi:hypothetical protein
MIETIQNVCELLSRDPLTAKQVAESLGKVTEAGELAKPFQVKPSDTTFSAASVVVDNSGSAPAYVELTPVQPIPIAALRARYTDAHPLARRDYNKPDQMLFNVDIPNMPRTCAIIADLTKQGDDIAARKLTIRRDVRLA